MNLMDRTEKIINEAKQLEEDVLYSSKARFTMGNFWYYLHAIFGIVVIGGSILFGALSFANLNWPIDINTLSLIVIIISMLQVFFNPFEQSRINKNIGDEYNRLKQEIRFFYNVEVYDNDFNENKDKIRKFAKEKSSIDYKSSPILGCFYNRAKKSIEKEEHKHKVDY